MNNENLVGMTETYAFLTKLGVSNKYEVIPEFVIEVKDNSKNKKRKIDLVYAKKIPDKIETNLDIWNVYYAFEIEGFNVTPYCRLEEHIQSYKYLNNKKNNQGFLKGFSILYTNAYHRKNWKQYNPTSLRKRIEYFNKLNGFEKKTMEIKNSDQIKELEKSIIKFSNEE